jgi:hypothetical protein
MKLLNLLFYIKLEKTKLFFPLYFTNFNLQKNETWSF